MESSTAAADGAAQDKVQQVAGQAQEKAQEAAGQAKDRAREQVEQRSTQAGEQVSTSANDLRSVAEHLRSEGKEQPAKLAEQAADRAERLGGYLKGADADQILRDIEDFGRKQPLAVVFGGLALGFAASRFLKASSQNRAGGGSAPSEQPRTGLPAPGDTAPMTSQSSPVEAPAPGISAHGTAPQPVGGGVR
jgi:uncharacterized protein YfiM (DUF2279 family)